MHAEGTSTTSSGRVEKIEESDDDFLLEKGETAYHVYKGLWHDFYDWEHDHSHQSILGLSRTETSFGDLPCELNEGFPDIVIDKTGRYTEWFTIECWNYQNSVFSVNHTPIQLVLEEGISPHPRYTACTPSSTNILYPANFLWTAPFLPFSDHEKFPIEEYLLYFKTFGWQTDFWDPDRELIFHETARRLCFTHQFSYPEIDNLQLYHLPLRRSAVDGLIWDISQRDCLLWPGSEMSMLPQLSSKHVDPNLSLYENIAKDSILFCDNLNCLHSLCQIHEHSHPIFPPKPSVTNEEIRIMDGPPCGGHCYKTDFLKYTEFEMAKVVKAWNDNDIRLFKSVIMIIPDTSPCDLAIICRKPCVEAYIHRLNCISNEDILEEKQESRSSNNITFVEDTLQLSDVKPDQVKPCYHPGRCNLYSNCACYIARQRCKRTCRCQKTCDLRFEGCKCSSSKPCAESVTCLCQKLGRECDPELCLTCDARHSKRKCCSRNTCRNTGLQVAHSNPAMWIRMSQYGLGAFAKNNIDSEKYIGEYVGEVIKEEAGPLAIIQKFLDLNYSFSFTENVTLDSHTIGNETRYLNHSNNDPNCYAKVKMVNGDMKIEICTNKPIKPNQELLLDYGEIYWNA